MASFARLTRRAEFLAAAKANYCAKGAVLIQMRPRLDDDPKIRVGFTATRKVGGAVVRNRAKRRLREAARACLPDLGFKGCDYVFVARSDAPNRPFALLLEDVRRALAHLAKSAAP
jgi:ribonuclease P protein component